MDAQQLRKVLGDMFRFNPKDFFVQASPTGYLVSIAKKSTPTEISTPNVDFFVDNFDRDDNFTLGDYWYRPENFRIIGQRAVAFVVRKTATYKNRISTANFNVKITFDIDTTRRVEYLAIGDNGESASAFGVLQFTQSLTIFTSSGQGMSIYREGSSESQSSGVFDFSATTASGNGTVLNVSMIDGYLFYDVGPLSGNVFTGPIIPSAGLSSRETIALVANISQIMAWSDDIPEPPTGESGHGYWDISNGFRYTDKYHEGGGYNPNA